MAELQERGQLTAREREALFQFRPNAPWYRLRSFLFGGAGDKDNLKVNEHSHDGRNFVSDTVAVGLDAAISGTFAPYYGEMPAIARNIFGQPKVSQRIAANYAADAAGTRRREVFEMPQTGAAVIDLWTLQFGTVLYKRVKTRSFSIDTSRNADGGSTSGSVELHANDVPNYDAPLPQQTPQNAILGVSANNVTTDGVFLVKPGSAAAQNVTFTVGDTTAQTVSKLAAIGITATVAGTVAISSGETHTLTGNGATGNATVYGTISIALGESAASVQTKIRALGGVYVGVVVSGSTTASSVSPGSAFTYSGAGDATYNGLYSPTGTTVNGGATFVNANGRYVQASGLYSATNPNFVVLSAAGAAESGALYSVTGPLTGPTGQPALNGTNGFSPAPTAAYSSITPASGSYPIAFPSTAGNVADITSTPGGGWSTAVTPPGGGVGNIVISVTAPAQTPISISKTSGTGWTGTVTQQGSDGTIGYLPDSAPMESDNVLIYMADTREQLEAISPLNEEAPEILLDVLGHTFSVGGLWNAVWTENRKLAPSTFVGGKPEVAFGLTVLRGSTSQALRVLQDGCVMGKKFFRIAYKCGGWEVWTDIKVQRNASQDRGADNDLPTRTTPFIAADDKLVTYRMTVIGPNGDYFIPA